MSDLLEKKLSATKTIAKKARSTPTHVAEDQTKDPPAAAAEPAEARAKSPKAGGTSPHRDEKNISEHAEQYDVKHPTGNSTRDKVRALLADALYREGEQLVEGKEEAAKVANAIEQAMHERFGGGSADYKKKYRNLNFNIKDVKNRKLRMALLHRHLPPAELLDMSDEDLANDDLKKDREKVHEKMTRDAMPYNKQEATTDMFRCGKCKERKCTYYQMQTRSADEPLTTFVSCVHCGNRWRF